MSKLDDYLAAFEDVPGTRVYTAQRARQGYHLNQFAMSLMKAANRERFKQDERAYLDEWPLTEEQKRAILDRDYDRMLELGANIYFLAKIFSTDGLSFVQAVSTMTGLSVEQYQAMMLAGGRSRTSSRAQVSGVWIGRVLLARVGLRPEVIGLPSGESKERTLTWLDASLPADLSRDGKTLLISELGEGGGVNQSIYLRKTDGSPATLIGEGVPRSLSPDGRQVALTRVSAGNVDIWLQDLVRKGAFTRLTSVPTPDIRPEGSVPTDARASWTTLLGNALSRAMSRITSLTGSKDRD